MWSLTLLGLAATVATAAHYDVTVGRGALLKFDPETINAVKGDTLTYQFFAKNHSVTQSSFAEPCHPLAGDVGFFSGFTPSASNDTAGPTTWTITVNDTKPVWVYCGQTKGDHCQKGMLHAINAPTTGNTFDAYKRKAEIASTSTSPPNGLPVGGLRKLHVDVAPGATLTYSPNNITELVGTVVEFSFNPANHSVVQSSFADPCHSLAAGGFSSGFIPTAASDSGVTFDITINDTKPIWFYCAQTKKTHCQAGMVGSINAPLSGNTLEAFIEKAKVAGLSTIPPFDPVGGILTVNGTIIGSFGGDVLASSNYHNMGSVPPPGTVINPEMTHSAGGAPPSNYSWPPLVSDNATNELQLLEFLDNLLLDILINGYNRLTTGDWKGKYPNSITDILGSLEAQAMVHRSSTTNILQHYNKQVIAPCKYSYPMSSPSDFIDTALTVLALEIGLVIDIMASNAPSDGWIVGLMASTLGPKSRMHGLLNMMQNHMPAAAVGEVALPPDLVYSYAMTHYVVGGGLVSGGSCPDPLPYKSNIPTMTITNQFKSNDRLTSMTVSWDASTTSGDLWMAYLGPWGGVEFSPIAVNKSSGTSVGNVDVPKTLYGHVWAAITTSKDVTPETIESKVVAGPEIIWITQPSHN